LGVIVITDIRKHALLPVESVVCCEQIEADPVDVNLAQAENKYGVSGSKQPNEIDKSKMGPWKVSVLLVTLKYLPLIGVSEEVVNEAAPGEAVQPVDPLSKL
jgi:hypothetical protein